MTILEKEELFERLREAVELSSWRLLVDDPGLDHPFLVRILREDASVQLRVYIWNITHGGGARRPAAEMRIQLTGIAPPLQIAPPRMTLLLGWYNDARVFAGFDARRHQLFSTRSPSIQIHREILENAARLGFGFQAKGNGEIAVGFRPDMFVSYVLNLEQLHGFGDTPQELEILQTAAAGTMPPEEDLVLISEERRRVARAVASFHREYDFRQRVLEAYSHTCTACGLQLRLVEAAHIIPVAVPGSTDETRNGLALCVLHHRAYDLALIAIDDEYRVKTSDYELSSLHSLGLAGGFERFAQGLRELILLPSRERDWPDPEFLRHGIQIRGWRAA